TAPMPTTARARRIPRDKKNNHATGGGDPARLLPLAAFGFVYYTIPKGRTRPEQEGSTCDMQWYLPAKPAIPGIWRRTFASSWGRRNAAISARLMLRRWRRTWCSPGSGQIGAAAMERWRPF